jgi:hypothetical protein
MKLPHPGAERLCVYSRGRQPTVLGTGMHPRAGCRRHRNPGGLFRAEHRHHIIRGLCTARIIPRRRGWNYPTPPLRAGFKPACTTNPVPYHMRPPTNTKGAHPNIKGRTYRCAPTTVPHKPPPPLRADDTWGLSTAFQAAIRDYGYFPQVADLRL